MSAGQNPLDSLFEETYNEIDTPEVDQIVSEITGTPPTIYEKFTSINPNLRSGIGSLLAGPAGAFVGGNPAGAINAISDVGAIAGAMSGSGALSVPLAGIGAGAGAYAEDQVRQFVGSPPEDQLMQLNDNPTINDALNTFGIDLLGAGAGKLITKAGSAIGKKAIEPMLANFPELDTTLREGISKVSEMVGRYLPDAQKTGSTVRGDDVIGQLRKTATSRAGKINARDEAISRGKIDLDNEEAIYKEVENNLSAEIKQAQKNMSLADQEARGFSTYAENQTKPPLNEINKQISVLEKELKTYANRFETGYKQARDKLNPLYEQKSSILEQKQKELDSIASFRKSQEEVIQKNTEALEQTKLAKKGVLDRRLQLEQLKPQFSDMEEALSADFLQKIVKEGSTPDAKKVIRSIIEDPETINISLKATNGKIKGALQDELFTRMMKEESPANFVEAYEGSVKALLPTKETEEATIKAYDDLLSFLQELEKPGAKGRIKPISRSGNTTLFNFTGNLQKHPIASLIGAAAGSQIMPGILGYGSAYSGAMVMSVASDKLMKAVATKPGLSEFLINVARGSEDISKAEWKKFLTAMAGIKVTVQTVDGAKKKSGVIEMNPTLKNYGSGRSTQDTSQR